MGPWGCKGLSHILRGLHVRLRQDSTELPWPIAGIMIQKGPKCLHGGMLAQTITVIPGIEAVCILL